MARIPVLINRSGGAASQDPKIGETVATALRDAGLEVDVELIDGGACSVRCAAIAERGDELVIVGGGDGTISAAASALVGTDTTLGILPLGTLNHFARDLGIPADVGEAVEAGFRHAATVDDTRASRRPGRSYEEQVDGTAATGILSADGARTFGDGGEGSGG